MDEEKGAPIYLNGTVFDFLPNIQKEFNYHGATLAESYEYHLSEVKKKIDENKVLFQALADASPDAAEQYRDLKVSMAFGLSNSVWPKASYYYEELHGGDDTEFLKFYKRAFMLQCAQMELRKLCVPGVRGPQHCGEIALKQFYDLVTPILQERVAESEAQRLQDEEDFG